MQFLDSERCFEISNSPDHSAAQVPAIFLDRDGVIIEDKHYLRDPEKVELIPGVAEKIRSLRNVGVPLVIVTNQSGIGQGMYGWDEYEAVHKRMIELLAVEQPFTAVYANAYPPTEAQAEWRKPNPGMFLQAASDLNLCLESSVMIGDKLVDLKAAERAGIKRLVHVMTGHGVTERRKVVAAYPQAELFESLADVDIDSAFIPLNTNGN